MSNQKQQKKVVLDQASIYLVTLNKLQMTPNFFMSHEYIEKAGMVWIEEPPLCGFKLTADTPFLWYFPPLNFNIPDGPMLGNDSYYAGLIPLPNINPDSKYHPFLDYQFIYNPQDFLRMEGGKWAVFRKNVRKYPKRNKGWLIYRPLRDLPLEGRQLGDLILNWCERKGNEIFDPTTFTKFCMNGKHRMGLWRQDKLVGINVWDENYRYVNYRLCLDNGAPFLNEYMRYLFYTSTEILSRGKWVNDGGALDSESLFKFKMKLNPQIVYDIYSYTKEGVTDRRPK